MTGQFGFIPGSSTTFALISLFHHWLRATDGTGVTVRTTLLDFRKALDLVDHNILVTDWIIDFLRDRKQRVNLMEFTLTGLMFLREFPRGLVLALGYSWC